MRCVGFIEARANSRRLPDKHLKWLTKGYVLDHVISTAGCSIFDNLILTSNDLRLFSVAQAMGIEAVERGEHLCGEKFDTKMQFWAAMEQHFYSVLKSKFPSENSWIIGRIQANSIIATPLVYKRAIEAMVPQADEVWSCVELETGYFHTLFRDDSQAEIVFLNKGKALGMYNSREDPTPRMYHPDSGIYLIRLPRLRPMEEARRYASINQKSDVIHIHTLEDLHMARAILHYKEHTVAERTEEDHYSREHPAVAGTIKRT